ncbi:MAG TPA: PIN domain-containing protein [Gemmataceae bacterium]|nr:PIN domain-containing protein [Gemmataceae bacterium]
MIALDSTAFFHAVQSAPRADRPGDGPEWEATRRFLDFLRRRGERIIVPNIVVGEFLQFFHDAADLRLQLSNVIRSGFRLVEFDFDAARHAADLNQLINRTQRHDIIRANDLSKQLLKTDFLIVATAMSHGARGFLAKDRGILATARAANLTPYDITALPADGDYGALFPSHAV